MTLQSRVKVRRPGQSAQAVTSCSKRSWPGAVKQPANRRRNESQDAGAGTWGDLRWPPATSSVAAGHASRAVPSRSPPAGGVWCWQARHHATRGHLHVRAPRPLSPLVWGLLPQPAIKSRKVHDKEYTIKRGALDPAPDSGCSILEAATALACAHPNPEYLARVTNSTDALWERGGRGAYDVLFHPPPPAHQIWRSVLTVRAVRNSL